MVTQRSTGNAATGRVVSVQPGGAAGGAARASERPPAPRRRRRLPGRAQVIRAAVGAHLVAAVCGLVGADYVGSAYFSVIVPALAGLACGWVVSRGAPGLQPVPRHVLAGLYGGASAAFAFVYSDTPYGATGSWLPPVLAGIAGAVLWPFVDPAG